MSVLYLQNDTDGFDVQIDTGGSCVLLREVIEWLKNLPER